ncbi:methionyl-tRNA formyltransferase [candidate division Kazan bacterium]|uniref:Methionyl-tRNA formyltransferase n=1 Tax=candidate division Kazan bacterium TaxID=2202143 RepID=A0A420ZDH8_UNCK3|nr:MAG: methionyl-tRNA formyltransferase [candidate division Kazan bacterium]
MNPQSYNVIFMGTPEFAVPSLKALIASPEFNVRMVITQPDKPAGRGNEVQKSPVTEVALTEGLPILQPETVKHNPELVRAIKSIAPDVIVVAAYGKILPQEILDIPKFGIVNVHASLLPKYRGASPIPATIINGDAETGVTIMKMELEMDAGPIIGTSKKITIDQDDTSATLSKKLAEIGAESLMELLPKYLSGEITPQKQNEAEASFVKLLEKEDGKIDWNESEEIIARKVRAYNPWPSAFTIYKGEPLKILETEYHPEIQNESGKVSTQNSDLYIGKLKILKLQPAGKKPMSGRDFLAGHADIADIDLRS